jgi:N-acyl-D-aspartate/D-glutamate deacylase
MYDAVVRGGLVYDGTGAAPRHADIGVVGSLIAAVGVLDETLIGPDTVVVDATGRIVTPGFVDAHTHYDGQITWDPYITPSTYHGVTTIVTGNCGVGFAPCRPEQRNWLIGLMEGVEDIPGTALHEGIVWEWESFAEYLDALDSKQFAIDVGTQVPHGAVRAYVMGERGPAHDEATPDEIADMAAVVRDAIAAGALGFTTSRTVKHKDSSGQLTPSITAHEDELVGIARALGDLDAGVLQGISDFYDFDSEFALFRKMAEVSGRPCSITVEQQDARPEWWTQLLEAITQAQADGLDMLGQVPPRATGVLLGLTATLHPFSFHEAYRPLHHLPLADKVEALRTPEVRAALINSECTLPEGILAREIVTGFHKMFRLGDPANYEPGPDESFAALAAASGVSPLEIALDALLANDGKALIYHPLFNYLPGNLDYVAEMLEHPHTVMGLSDGGAHCGVISDASFPTTLIQHWGRDRTAGPKIALERLVSMQTLETARLVGLNDRGVLAAGYKADINVIDFEHLVAHEPVVEYDLPAGGRRLVQRATGYNVTLVSGQVAFRDGEPTGVLVGKLIRGAQAAPTSS